MATFLSCFIQGGLKDVEALVDKASGCCQRNKDTDDIAGWAGRYQYQTLLQGCGSDAGQSNHRRVHGRGDL